MTDDKPTKGTTRGVHVDYCPHCGVVGPAPCQTPSGYSRHDHKARQPECNGRVEACNLHGAKAL